MKKSNDAYTVGHSGNAIAGRKLKSLDGLRAIAIILVFCHHALMPPRMNLIKDHIPAVSRGLFYFRCYLGQGWIGVDLFFVLSGFLITGILLDTREASNYFSGFYARRILRIFPLYYSVLIGIIVLSWILTNLHAPQAAKVAALVPLPEDRWVYFCYLTNWVGLWKQQWNAHFASFVGHFWSLGVEEQFYFFWPLIVWLVRPRSIPWIAGIVAALSAILRIAWAAHVGIPMLVAPKSVEITFATICRLDALFIGALCAYFFRDPKLMARIDKWLLWIAAWGVGLFFIAFTALLFYPQRAGLMLCGPSPSIPHIFDDEIRIIAIYGGYSLLALGFGGLVLHAAYTENSTTLLQKVLASRVLAPIGKYSYGIYVFHIPIMGFASIYVFEKLQIMTGGELVIAQCAYIVAVAIACFVIAALSYELFEKRILGYKRYFEPKYAPVPCVALEDVAEEAAATD